MVKPHRGDIFVANATIYIEKLRRSDMLGVFTCRSYGARCITDFVIYEYIAPMGLDPPMGKWLIEDKIGIQQIQRYALIWVVLK